MFAAQEIPSTAPRQTFASGVPVLRRGEVSPWVAYLEAGRVVLGVIEGGLMLHQLGLREGPCWLEATSAVLCLPDVVDVVTEGSVVVRCVPVAEFQRSLGAMTDSAQAVLHDVALAHRQQTELAVSRVAKDAQARCAEWLLRHAQTSDKGRLAVPLGQRKQALAAQLGIAPETLSRVLRHLRERSLISGSGRTLNLVDPGGLRLLAGA